MQQQIQTAMLVHPAQAAPQRVQFVVNRVNYATVNPALLHLQNPQFQPPPSPGQVRSSFDLPTLIAPASAATPDMLFSAPRDPAKRFFLTHYGIAIAPGAGPRVAVGVVGVDSSRVPPDRPLDRHNARGAIHRQHSDHPRRCALPHYRLVQARTVNWDLTPAASPSGAALTLILEHQRFRQPYPAIRRDDGSGVADQAGRPQSARSRAAVIPAAEAVHAGYSRSGRFDPVRVQQGPGWQRVCRPERRIRHATLLECLRRELERAPLHLLPGQQPADAGLFPAGCVQDRAADHAAPVPQLPRFSPRAPTWRACR